MYIKKLKLSINAFLAKTEKYNAEVVTKDFPYNKDHDRELWFGFHRLRIVVAKEKIGW